MKGLNIKTIIINLENRLRDFLDRTILVILIIILMWVGFGSFIGYKYLIYPVVGDFPHENDLIKIDTKSYLAVYELWIKREERLKAAEEKEFTDPFFPTISPSSTIPTSVVPTEPINNEITADELEDLLVRTLFEFYQMRGEEMPLISERALIWEKLGLGTAQEYQGTHSQNILLLKTLMQALKERPWQPSLFVIDFFA